MTTSKKITLATVKSFIRKNEQNLYVKVSSSFDGMIDGISYNKNAAFAKVTLKKEDINIKHTLGIDGAWFVGGSRNWFNMYELDGMICISVSNCCGSFTIAAKN